MDEKRLIVLFCIFTILALLSIPTISQSQTCGNSICDTGENPENCLVDCPKTFLTTGYKLMPAWGFFHVTNEYGGTKPIDGYVVYTIAGDGKPHNLTWVFDFPYSSTFDVWIRRYTGWSTGFADVYIDEKKVTGGRGGLGGVRYSWLHMGNIYVTKGRHFIDIETYSIFDSILITSDSNFNPDTDTLPEVLNASISENRLYKSDSSLDGGAKGYVIGEIKNYEMILNDFIPSKEISVLNLWGSTNQYISGTFVIRALKDINSLEVSCTDLSGPSVIKKEEIDLRVVHVWRRTLYLWWEPHNNLGLMPDILMKDDRQGLPIKGNQGVYGGRAITNIPAHTSKQIWVTVHFPDGTPPGNYTGTINLKSDTFYNLPIEIEILPIDLKDAEGYYSLYFTSQPVSPSKWWSYLNPESYTEMLRDMVRHGMNTVFLYGNFSSIYFAKEAGMTEAPCLMEWPESNTQSQIAEAKSIGFPDLYYYGVDEPHTQEQIDRTINEATRRQSLGEGVHMMTAINNYAAWDVIKDYVDRHILVISAFDNIRLSNISYAKEKGYNPISYFAGNQMYPLYYRAYSGIYNKALGYMGSSMWAYFDSYTRPVEIQKSVQEVLDDKYPDSSNLYAGPKYYYQMIYPDEYWYPVPTMRYEAYRDGIDDVRYVEALNRSINKAEKLEQNHELSQAISEGKALLSNILNVPSGTPGRYYSILKYNPGDLDKIRRDIADAIVKIDNLASEDFCGNNICDSEENSFTCPQDCPNLIQNPGFEEISNNWAVGWTPYGYGYTITDGRTGKGIKITKMDSNMYGARQTIVLDQTQANPIMVSGWSKAEDVSGVRDHGYSLYSDVAYRPISEVSNGCTDNCIMYAQTAAFSVGSHDWQYSYWIIYPQYPIKYLTINTLLRYDHNGTVYFDDLEIKEIDDSPTEYGCRNDENSVCLNLGENESVGSYSPVMGSIKGDDIKYREILPKAIQYFSLPAFNVDSLGYPLTPMVLEVKYMDEIDDNYLHSGSIHTSKHRAYISSYLGYFYDENVYGLADKRYIRGIADIGGKNDGQWKVSQYAFNTGNFPLIRASDNLFKFMIVMPSLGSEDDNLYLPIDYVALHKITQEEYINSFYEPQKKRINFYEVELPKDSPDQASYTGLVSFIRDPMRPIYEHTIPKQDEVTNKVSIFSAQGEIEPISLSLYSSSRFDGITIDATDLIGSNGLIPKSRIRIEKVVFDERRTNIYYLGKSYAKVRDRLEPFDMLSVDRGVVPLWIKILVPDDAGGSYNGKIYISQNGNVIKSMDVNLEVLPIKLDASKNMNSVYHFPYYKTYSSNLSEVYRVYRETGFDPHIILRSEYLKIIKSNGVINDYDLSVFEGMLDKMKSENHLRKKADIYLANWQDVFYNSMGKRFTENPNIYSELSDQKFVDAMKLLFSKIVDIGNERGVTFNFAVTDEPGKDPYLRIITDRVFTILKGMGQNTSVTYWEVCDNEIETSSYIVPGGKIPPLTDLVDYKVWLITQMDYGYSKNYSTFSFYTTYLSDQDNPIYNRFAHGLFAYKTDARDIADYAMGDIIVDPYNEFDQYYSSRGSHSNPDFVYSYPTKTGKLLDSFSLEGIREGIKDAKYLATLERLITENPEPSVSVEAKKYLDTIKSRVNPNLWSHYIKSSSELGFYETILEDISDTNNPEDWEAFTTIRRRIFDYIKLLTVSVEKTQNKIIFISPTPTTSQRLSTGRFMIKAQINSPTLQSLQFIWNSKNYPILPQGTILKYNFDQNTQIGETSTTFKDLTTKANNGVGINLEGDESIQGKVNKALRMDGINDRIQVPHNPSHRVTSNGTWNYWVKLNSYDKCQAFISKRDTHNANAAWAMGINFGYPGANKNLTFEYNVDGTRNWAYGYEKTSIPLDQWVMLTFVYNSQDPRNVRFYVNGKEIEPILEEAQNSPLYNSNSPIYIGAVNNGSACHFNGSIDELLIVGEALAQDEIHVLYESSLVKQDSSTWVFTLNKGDTTPIPQGTYTYSLTTSDPSVGSESRILFVGAETSGPGSQETGGGETPGQGSPGGGQGTVSETKKGTCNSGDTNPCGSSIGECKQGTQSCVNGQWTECIGAIDPTEEICDGLDNNCNGQIDENCLCVEGQNKPCGSNIGICKQGVQSCVDGQWGACIGNTPPLTEDICFNYLDDNCNGEVDEGCGEAFNTCNNGKLDEGEQGTDCGGKCPKKCPDLEMISVLMILVGLFGMIGTTVYFGYIR